MAALLDATWKRLPLACRSRLHEDYLRYRIASTAYLGNHISDHGVPIVQPPGGHAIYLDAKAFLPHIPVEQFPGVALATELYLEGGIRSVEIGSLMFAGAAKMELVRLAIPRRVYTQSHIDYVVEIILQVFARREQICGMKLTYEAPFLRHFTAHLEPSGSRGDQHDQAVILSECVSRRSSELLKQRYFPTSKFASAGSLPTTPSTGSSARRLSLASSRSKHTRHPALALQCC